MFCFDLMVPRTFIVPQTYTLQDVDHFVKFLQESQIYSSTMDCVVGVKKKQLKMMSIRFEVTLRIPYVI